MKKKIIIISSIIALLILFLASLIFIGAKNGWWQKKVNTPVNDSYPTAASSADWTMVTREPLPIEYMKDEEKTEIGLATSTIVNPAKIQVLKRDENGKITMYKLIYDDSELVKYK